MDLAPKQFHMLVATVFTLFLGLSGSELVPEFEPRAVIGCAMLIILELSWFLLTI